MPIIQEGVTLTDDVIEITDWLQSCFEKLEAGEEIMGDPFYKRSGDRPPLTDEEVDKVVKALDAEYAFEIGSYPGYHRNRSGAETTPDFHRFSPASRRALVEGADAILQRHKAASTEKPQEG